MVFVSLGIRALINVEALNMVEAVGNVVRHRTVPYIYRRGRSYVIQWAPAISGECLAHAYQVYLAKVATKRGLPVCYWCMKEEFIKHFDLRFWVQTKNSISYTSDEVKLADKYKELGAASLDQMKEIERTIVKVCIVEDIGGFLVTQGAVKRTSRVWFSYMIPTLDSISQGAVAVDNQFLVRHAPTAESLRKTPVPPAQAPYYPQIASAIYGFTITLDVDSISSSSIDGEPLVPKDEYKKRVLASLEAVKEMLDSKIFGAKLSRFNPMMEYEIIVALVSKSMKLMISPPTLGLEDFINDTIIRAVKAATDTGDEIKVIIWPSSTDIEKRVNEVLEKLKKQVKDIEKFYEVLPSKVSTVRDLINKVIEVVKSWKGW